MNFGVVVENEFLKCLYFNNFEQLIAKMNRKSALLLLLCLILSPVLLAQKVKYKDLILLLNAKQYEQAEPFLKKYLKDNEDNPNAFLFMGIIFQEKASKKDVLKETEAVTQNMDSAILFYEKAYKEIDEKEIKRNSEYYEAYNRRDLRTGEFGVKLSDVKFDLEKKMQSMKERKESVKKLKEYYTSSELLYSEATARFKFMQSKYGTQRGVFLQSTEKTNAELQHITDAFDSLLIAFENYKNTSQVLGKTGYNQVLNLQPVKDFEKDGHTPADFTKDDLRLWDFKTWAETTKARIEKEVNPIREQLVTYDIELNKLREKLRKDSVSVRNELDLLSKNSPVIQLKAFDPDPLPGGIFEMKKAELEYNSDQISDRQLKDSANVNLQITLVSKELSDISRLNGITDALLEKDFVKEGENYTHFITNAYGTVDVLKSLVKATKEYAEREKLRKEKESEIKSQLLKWVIAGKDSIPIFIDETISKSRFKPMIIKDENYTSGLVYGSDSLATGYFYTVTPSRVPDIKISFPVDKPSFKIRNLAITKGLSTTDGKNQVYFVLIYSESKVEEKFSATLAKIYRSDGLAWCNNYKFDLLPSELIFNQDSGELSIKISNSGDSKVVTLDKNGKLIQ
jgi:hypothetical protein